MASSDKNKLDICIIDGKALNPGDLSWENFRGLGNLTIYEETTPDQILSRAKKSDIIITNKVVFDAKTLSELPCLKCIVVTATGYNNIDIEAAKSLGIAVCNAPNYSTLSVAQHVFALIMHIYNRVGEYVKDTAQGKWCHTTCFCNNTYPTQELNNKTIGIVGLGNIGMKVAEIAHAFGMKTIAITSKKGSTLPEHIKPVDKETLFRLSDIITLHIPLTPQTTNYINKDSLELLKTNAIIINTARGSLVNELDIATALNNNTLLAYAADVLSSEPPSQVNPLLHAKNAFITPHIAWATRDARQRLINITYNNVKAFISNNPINTIN